LRDYFPLQLAVRRLTRTNLKKGTILIVSEGQNLRDRVLIPLGTHIKLISLASVSEGTRASSRWKKNPTTTNRENAGSQRHLITKILKHQGEKLLIKAFLHL